MSREDEKSGSGEGGGRGVGGGGWGGGGVTNFSRREGSLPGDRAHY